MLLKTCVSVLSMILLLHTSCYAWCPDLENAASSGPNAVPSPLPPCHGSPEKDADREPKPVHNDESCEGCLYLQVAENRTSLNTLAADSTAVLAEGSVIEFAQRLGVLVPSAMSAEFSNSPPSRPVLRI